VFGVGMLAEDAFPLYATGWSWLITALGLVNAAVFLFYGFNARRAARVYRHPGGLARPGISRPWSAEPSRSGSSLQ
jgi:hypothetical protein